MKTGTIAILAVAFLMGASGLLLAGEGDWKVEVVPYVWMAGIDGEIAVGDRKADVEVGFDDLLDKTDAVLELMTLIQYRRWVVFAQYDYMALSEDKNVSAGFGSGVDTKISLDNHFLAVTGGYQFDGPFDGSTIDVLGGVRYLRMETELDVGSLGTDATVNITDGVIMLRPSVYLFADKLNQRLRFNFPVSIGAGDSDLTYELQPYFQVRITNHIDARLGYRTLYYDVKGDRVDFEGAFHGMMIGIGIVS